MLLKGDISYLQMFFSMCVGGRLYLHPKNISAALPFLAVGVGDSIHSSPVAIRGDLVLMSYCKLVERRDGDSTTLLAFSMFSGVIYMYVMQSGQFHMYKINKFSVTVPSTVSKDLTLALCMTVQDGSGLT